MVTFDGRYGSTIVVESWPLCGDWHTVSDEFGVIHRGTAADILAAMVGCPAYPAEAIEHARQLVARHATNHQENPR